MKPRTLAFGSFLLFLAALVFAAENYPVKVERGVSGAATKDVQRVLHNKQRTHLRLLPRILTCIAGTKTQKTVLWFL